MMTDLSATQRDAENTDFIIESGEMEAARIEGFRGFFSRNVQPICFLVAYFILVVLGNLIYASPWGYEAIAITEYPTAVLQLNHIFSTGFWVLLLMPFVVTPAVVYAVKRLAGDKVDAVSRRFPELTERWFVILFTLACAYVLFSFYRHGVAELFMSGRDSISSVVARFEIRERLSFVVFIVLQAVVPYLSYAAIINASKRPGWFWKVAAIISIVMASLFFIMINMKWPVVLYYAGAVLAIFMHTERHAYAKAIVGGVLVVATYLLISTVVFRFGQSSEPPVAQAFIGSVQVIEDAELSAQGNESAIVAAAEVAAVSPVVAQEPAVAVVETAPSPQPPMVPESRKSASIAERAAQLSEVAMGAAPSLMMHLVNRMSIPYPYYYQEFTDHPSACGGILAQARPGPKCRPSTYIYDKMFAGRADQFLGKGTAPAAVHISGYAVGGWPVAVISLLCASIIMGIMASMPLNASSTISAFGIMGALAGYHFSQVPGEGVIFYEHGLFWTFSVMIGYCILVYCFGRQPGSQGPVQA